jgi:formylglycine-generating enzyme required for sulfatase activity
MMHEAGRLHARRIAVWLAALLAVGWLVYEARGRLRAVSLRDRLLQANIANVSGIVDEMADDRRWLDPLLHDAWSEAAGQGDADRQLRASLALVQVDPRFIDHLRERMLTATAEEFVAIRDALKDHAGAISAPLWTVARDVNQPAGARFRAGCALATYDATNDAAWVVIEQFMADELVSLSPLVLRPWMEALEPVRQRLIPHLGLLFHDSGRRQSERDQATDVLIRFASDQPEVLANLLLAGDPAQFERLLTAVEPYRERVADRLVSLLTSPSPPSQKPALDEQRDERLAQACVALLRLGKSGLVWPHLRHSPRPQVRSFLVRRLATYQVDPAVLAARLEQEHDVSARRAIILGLGGYQLARLPDDLKGTLLVLLEQLNRDADAGLRAAAQYVLQHWGQADRLAQSESDPQSKAIESGLGWYLNSQGQTMVILRGPSEYDMGSAATDPEREGGPLGQVERRRRVTINHSFAIGDKEITVRQYKSFRPAQSHNATYATAADCPMNIITWFDAAAYCNWLSEQEGLPKDQWCYVIDATDILGRGVRVAPGYLERTGYRLPTEVEWEYACRAGSDTTRFYGDGEKLLTDYAWYTKNSEVRWLLPVGSLPPNDFGMFDMLGNALEWCQDGFVSGTEKDAGKFDRETVVDPDLHRVLRGGAFVYGPGLLRSAARIRYRPTERDFFIGFRVARTLPADN